MKEKVTKVIETERLVLRPFNIEDANDMFDHWCHDPDVTKYLTWMPHKDVEESRSIAKLWQDGSDNNELYQWAIVLKSSDQVIGSIGVVNDNETTKMAEIGYALGKKYWHQGITSEASGAIIHYLFACGYERIQAKHDINNPNSGKVMEKCGMKKEGILRRYAKNNQGIVNVAMYAILKEDFYQS